MARPIDEFLMAWRALSGVAEGEGLRSIPVTPAGPCVLMAGRRFPGNEEVLLAGFSSAKVSANEKLPEGFGFEISRADPRRDGQTWLALTRRRSGSTELFAGMVGDVAGAMDAVRDQGEERILRTFLSRVRSWQEFMRKGGQALSPEAELGLVGELSFLGTLLKSGVPAQLAVEAWVGALDGVQDFELGTGAVEVKATLSSQGFPAKIGSIGQLDDSLRKPLFVTGIRLAQREPGMNLPEFAASIHEALDGDHEAVRMFGDRLLAAGYHEAHIQHYSRRFVLEEMRIIEVKDGFPRIILGNIPEGILRASYEINLDRVPGPGIEVSETLERLGAL